MAEANRNGTGWWSGASRVGKFFMILEGGAYVAAALFALVWLVRRLQGTASRPDDVERGGLWVLGFLTVGLLVLAVRKASGRATL